MAFLKSTFVLALLVAVLVGARHVHPKTEQWIDLTGERIIDVNDDHNRVKTEVVDIKPNKLSPLSSVLFFKSYDPCEDGFKLDYLGICREVWF